MLLGAIIDGKFYTAAEILALPAKRERLRGDYPTPQVSSDYQPYLSPLGTGWVDGRRARREDLARGGCRPQEKGEGLGGVYHNKDFARKWGKEWTPPPDAKPLDFEPAPFERKAVKGKKR